MTTRRQFLLGTALLLFVNAFAADAPASKTVRLLTVGNSFSRDATRYLGDLATADGNKLIHLPIMVSGAPLQLHAEKAQAFERDPKDEIGLYANGHSLKQDLLAERWDFVTIQQASLKSHDVATYRPHAAWLRDYIRQHAPQAELLLHQTWEYRVDDPRFSVPEPEPGEPKTQLEMYQGLASAYGTIAKELGVRRLPVGDAFHLANNNPQWGYRPSEKFDPQKAKPSGLPDQTHSLNVGWHWMMAKDGKQTLGMDGHHANIAGRYLGACVWYEVIFGRSAVGNSFVPKELDPAYAKFLQETAHRAVGNGAEKKRLSASDQCRAESIQWTFASGAVFRAAQNGSNDWGVAVSGTGLASVSQKQPVELEFWLGDKRITNIFSGYKSVARDENGIVGNALVRGPNDSKFSVEDRWRCDGANLHLARTVKVEGHSTNGFASGFQFDFTQSKSWTNADWFAPGMIYGGFEFLAATAIGGQAHYKPGNFAVRIREDRLPAPLVLSHFADDSWIAVMNPAPRGDTTALEGNDVRATTLLNERFQFGAMGGQERDGKLSLGYWFPGGEGEVTYAGNTYPGGQLHAWRRRFHPIQNGFAQKYEVTFQFGKKQAFPESMTTAWRSAWKALHPQVTTNNIASARCALVDTLASNVIETNGRAGIPLFINAVTGDRQKADRRAIMGFCGKNLEAVNFLLQESSLEKSPRAEELRRKAEAIATSFLKMKMSPPQGEGFNLDDGAFVCSQHKDGVMYLRSFGDDVKMFLRAYLNEKKLGREHPEWLRWCRDFGDWLLPQQQSNGGFPRAWKFPSAEIASDSPNASFNAVPMLVLLNQITGEKKYLDAAGRAADFCWNNGQSRGRFVGGTIDNPDVLDKEASTLSLEAYLSLYETTRDAKWLTRAKAAADFAETWIYIWNVLMPPDDKNPNRHWKAGVSTVGVQLIATGHSLVDDYMSFDADEFAKLFKFTGDPHYYEVARLLLHNTKNMLSLPAHPYDLFALGWQQEHWSLAPRRGYGLHRGWLPWVSTSQLNGIFGLMNLDRDLFEKLCRAEDVKTN